MTGMQLPLELVLQLLLQLVDLGLRVLLEALDLDVSAARFPSRAAPARVVAHHGAALLQLLLVGLQLLVLRRAARCTFFSFSACTLAVAALPSADSAAMRWMLMKATLAPSGNGRARLRRGRLRAGGRRLLLRGRGRRRRRLRREARAGARQREARARDNGNASSSAKSLSCLRLPDQQR